ncbi:MAG: tRNA (cytidine(34)-2'-O)-methyltransferase [Clostridia bacterium]|nr:tRNA (cytidine(34)-2'-O)-methyltransferase [Clostridia bacterium]
MGFADLGWQLFIKRRCGFEVINIVLVEPEIPMNTGNIARTCAATGSALHLVKPLGFDISDKALKRAGLDYWSMLDVSVYENLDEFFLAHPAADLWLTTTRGLKRYCDAPYRDGCFLFFGKETAGLPQSLLDRYPDRCVRLPMRSDARSLNLANTAAIVTYEALRQMDFPALESDGRRAWAEQKATHKRK